MRFRAYGVLALGCALLVLVLLLGNIILRGVDGFRQTTVSLPVHFSAQRLEVAPGAPLTGVPTGAYLLLIKDSLLQVFPDEYGTAQMREMMGMVSPAASGYLRRYLLAHPDALGATVTLAVPASRPVDQFLKSRAGVLSNTQQQMLASLQAGGRVESRFNTGFFTHADSRLPEQAGFFGAIAGAFFTIVVCFMLAFPIGVAAAVYLEEYAPRNRLTEWLEVTISNLAAVPSIVFGLLGLSVYINVMHLPRSAPVVGGLTLALMMLPVMIIATRAALGSVPLSIRHAALALGATPLQAVWHHSLPLAMPGIMTGTILGLSRAVGETAPLLMIGMVAFVADVPSGFADPATVMPVQIYLWATSPESGFVEKTASGILVLILLLLAMNAVAIYIRKRYEVRW